MGIIQNIIDDYEKLIKTRITIPLNSGDIIQFMFRASDLPHLLGLQYLVDIPELFEYSQNRLSATKLYKGMCDGTYDLEAYEKSAYFDELYNNRIKYFTTDTVIEIVRARQIVKFDPKKIKDFSTKMEKLQYMFWKEIIDDNNNYGYFGIGFMATGRILDENYPNTFFFRADNQYIYRQEKVLPTSLLIIDKDKNRTFEVYWEDIRKSMTTNPHYKFIHQNIEVWEAEKIIESENENLKRHYRLLRLDELNKAYCPYMDSNFRWTNSEKEFVLTKMQEQERVLLPNEIKMLLNTYKQLHSDGV